MGARDRTGHSLRNLNNLWKWRERRLKTFGPGNERAFELDELLACRLGVGRAQLAIFDGRLNPSMRLRLLWDFWALRRGKPLAYIVGEQTFLGMRFVVNKATFIPRPETEELVGLLGAEDDEPKTLLDLGTGSGNIAVAVAKQRPNWQVVAVDRCRKALRMARRNARTLLDEPHQQRIEFQHADYRSKDFWKGEQVDFVVGNPPYIGLCERDSLAPSVRRYEPKQALFSGETGLEHYELLSTLLPRRLRAGGGFFFEVGHQQAQNVRSMFAFATSCKVQKDLNGHERFVFGRL